MASDHPPFSESKESRFGSALTVSLQQFFDANPTPTRAEREQQAHVLGLNESQIENWYKYKRRCVKKFLMASEPSCRQPKLFDRDVRFDMDQVKILNRFFEAGPNPNKAERKRQAEALGLKEGQVVNWYKHKRRSVKKQAPQDHSDDILSASSSYDSQSGALQINHELEYHLEPTTTSVVASAIAISPLCFWNNPLSADFVYGNNPSNFSSLLPCQIASWVKGLFSQSAFNVPWVASMGYCSNRDEFTLDQIVVDAKIQPMVESFMKRERLQVPGQSHRQMPAHVVPYQLCEALRVQQGAAAPQMMEKLQTIEGIQDIHPEAIKAGIQSVVALPLRHSGKLVGCVLVVTRQVITETPDMGAMVKSCALALQHL